tara:strand:+ start:47 stop:610 length:564 start_codon:yes stop_codon:yes gene_type:complete
MAQNRKMPIKNVIKKYWDKDSNGECRIRFIGDFGWKELPTNACWRCGEYGYVEKSHIWSRCYSMDDSPSNLHLLCGVCHDESEFFYGFEPGLFYYEWFYSGRQFWFHKLINKFVPHDVAEKLSDVKLGMKILEPVVKMLCDGTNKLEEESNHNGKMMWDKERHDRFEQLSKEKGEDYRDYMIHEGVF